MSALSSRPEPDDPVTSALAELLEQAPAFVAVLLGDDHRVAYASPPLLALFGRDEADVSGRAAREALPEVTDAVVGVLDRVRATGVPYHGREAFTGLPPVSGQTSGPRSFHVTVVPVQSAGATASGVMLFAVEVTDEVTAKRRADDAEHRYRSALDGLPILAWTRDEAGPDFVNARWGEYTGQSTDNPRSIDWLAAVHPDDRAIVEAHLASGDAYQVEYRLRRHDGAFRWHLVRSLPFRGPGGRVVGRFGTATDIHDQKRNEGRLRLLAEAGALLAESLDLATTARAAVDVVVPAFADGAVLHVAQPDGAVVPIAAAHVGRDPADVLPDVTAFFTADRASFGPAAVVRSRATEWVRDVDEAVPAEAAAAMRARGVRAYASVPLVARGEALGAMTFVQAESGRTMTPEDVSTAEELARRVALALGSASAYDAARAGTLAIARLHRVTARLAEAASASDVARVTCEDGRDALQADTAVFWSREADGSMHLLGNDGVPAEFVSEWRVIPPDGPAPGAAAVAHGRPIWVETPEQYRALDADVAARAEAAGRLRPFAAVPLTVEGRPVGLVAFSFSGIHRFTEAEKDYVGTVCRHAAQALERARAHDAELRSNERLKLLAVAGEVLSGSLDYRETLRTLARTVVPGFADWCTVDLVDGNDVARVAVEHRDPQKRAIGFDVASRFPVRLDRTGWLQTMIATRRTQWVAVISEEALRASAYDAEHAEALLALGLHSAIQVPLVVDDAVVGVVTFIRSESERSYGEDDVRLAEEIGRRASLAATNAKLFGREQEARRRLARLQVVTAALATAATPADVAHVATAETAQALGYATAALYRNTPGGLVLVKHHGLSTGAASAFATYALDEDGPVSVAARSRQSLFFDTAEELFARFPTLRGRGHLGEDAGATAYAPLETGTRVIGVLAYRVGRDHVFSSDDKAFVHALAEQCVQAKQRAELLGREQRANERLAVLARAGETFASTIDYETTLRYVASVAMPSLADFCFFDVVEDNGVRRIAGAHEDPETLGLLEQTRWVRSERTDMNLCALSSGEPAIHAPIDDAWMQRVAAGPEHLDLLRKLGLRSMVTVPVRARGELLGALTVCFGRSGRHHDSDDLELARELATRGGYAITQARLYREARESARQAEEASRIKDEFLATVSHELRTPLNAIVGWSALLTGDRLKDPKAVTKGLDVIQRNARAQARIIEDVLDVARIVSGKLRLDPKPVDLLTVVREAADVVRPSAEAKGVRLDVTAPARDTKLLGDGERLRQVVWNVLSNAVKFTGNGGHVGVCLTADETTAVLRVEDSGQGISPEFLPHVFERFRQADSSSTRTHGGLGLGLAIARHIVELHGGTITAESDGIGLGATFIVRLPVRTSHEERFPSTPPAGADAHAALAGRRILVVDDDPDAREVVSTLLADAGAVVVDAASAEEALAVVARVVPDLVVSDIAMAGEDGYSFIQKLRKLPRSQGGSAFAVALTAYARPEDRLRALAAGYTTHVPKPIQPAELLGVISNLLAVVA